MKKLALIIILLFLCGEYVDARLFTDRVDRVVSDLKEATSQKDLMKISSSFEELTYIYNEIDDLEQVDSICFQLIDLNKMLYGEKSAEYGRALCRYAGAKLRKRDNATAKKYLKLGEPIIMAAVGDRHPYYATVLEAKGTVYFVNNRFKESAICYSKAESIYKEAISYSKEVLSKYRADYAGVIAMKNYAQFLSGDNPSSLNEDYVEIERLYLKDNDEIGLSDALMLKAQIEVKSRDLFAARHDTERVLNILNKNFGNMKIFKMINTAMQLANILQLLGDFQSADILIDQEIDDILKDPKLDQYGALGSLYMMKTNGYIQNNINSEDAEYFSEKAMSLLGKESYLFTNYLCSKYYHSVALGRNGKLEEAAAETLECLNSIKNNVYSINDLEKKYDYWFQYTNVLMQISPEKALDVLGDIEKSFIEECSRHLKKRQFASIRLSYLIQLAGCRMLIYSENRSENNFVKTEQAWKDVMDFFPQGKPYDDKRSLYINLAQLYALHGDSSISYKYSKIFYDYIKEYIFGTLATLNSKDRGAFHNKLSSFSQSIMPSVVGQTTSGAEVNLLLNYSFMSKSLLLATDLHISEIVRKSGDTSLEQLYSSYLKAKDNNLQELKLAETALLRNPIIRRNMINLKNFEWQNVQKALLDDEAAVEFLEEMPLGDEDNKGYLAIVIRSSGLPTLIRLANLNKKKLDNNFDFNSIASTVWKPLEKELKGIEHLYFSPAGILHNLPIENFSGSASRTHHRLSSLSEILKKSQKKSELLTGGVALFGGLEYDSIPEAVSLPTGNEVDRFKNRGISRDWEFENQRAGVRYLPASLTEITSIGKTLKERDIPFYSFEGAKGSEEQFKALSGKKISVLHIATHGFYYNSDNAVSATRSLRKMFSADKGISEMDRAMTRSGLLLSGANHKLTGKPLSGREDGVLTAMEISAIDFYDTSLAVLSACQSGLGDISAEGVWGIPRALKKAGVQTILMSLWKVDDEATSILMDNFYKSYTEGKSASESLSIAQNELKKDSRFQNPYYWSAFVVMDDVKSLAN